MAFRACRAEPLAALALAFTVAAQTPVDWQRARLIHSDHTRTAAWDRARGRLVMLETDGLPGCRTWEWDGADWLLRAEGPDPGARQWSAMAFDATRRQMIVFGGADQNGTRNDTWLWNGVRWTRSLANGPPAMHSHAMAEDELRQRVVLFGGTSNSSVFAQTWTWDGTGWQQANVVASPPARHSHAMSWDPVRGEIVMYGGASPAGFFQDTWIWNGTGWAQRTPGSWPGSLSLHAMAFDAVSGRTMLYGGSGTFGPSDSVSFWNGVTWSSGGAGPLRCEGHALVADPDGRRIVLVGGNAGTRTHTHWDFDGSRWTQRPLPNAPPGRLGFAAAFDLSGASTVLFAAFDGRRNPVEETWELTGSSWRQRNPAHRPPARLGFAMAHDLVRGRTVLFGGRTADTWEWDGSDWTQVVSTGPAARFLPAMAYDVGRQQVVLFGGRDEFSGAVLADTWSWNGNAWTRRTPATVPPGREAHALVYHFRRGTCVLVGGGDFGAPRRDTWEWNGSNWSPAPGSATTPDLASCQAVYDLGRDLVVAIDGAGATFEWDGAAWSRPAIALLSGFGNLTVAYDLVWQRCVLFEQSRRTRFYGGNLSPATVALAGQGCGVSPPDLVATAPELGSRASTIDLLAAPAGAPAVLGLATATQALPIGACTVWLAGDAAGAFVVTNANGFANLKLTTPPGPSLRGTAMYAQGVVLGSGGLQFSNALRLGLGD